MAYNVLVTVGTFTPGGNSTLPEWGYVVDGDFGSHQQFSWDSEESFYRAFPTLKKLWENVLNADGFDIISVKDDDEGNIILDEDDCPINVDVILDIYFEHCGYDKEKAAKYNQTA